MRLLNFGLDAQGIVASGFLGLPESAGLVAVLDLFLHLQELLGHLLVNLLEGGDLLDQFEVPLLPLAGIGAIVGVHDGLDEVPLHLQGTRVVVREVHLPGAGARPEHRARLRRRSLVRNGERRVSYG